MAFHSVGTVSLGTEGARVDSTTGRTPHTTIVAYQAESGPPLYCRNV